MLLYTYPLDYFIYSRKSCDNASIKLQLSTVFANFRFYLLQESTSTSTSARQYLYKLATNSPQLIEYGGFCKITVNTDQVQFRVLLLKRDLHLGLLCLNASEMSKNKFQ